MMFDDEGICIYPDEYTKFLHLAHLMTVCCSLNIFAFTLLRQCMSAKSPPKRKLSDPPQHLSIDVEQPELQEDDFTPSRGDSPYGLYHRSFRQ